MKLRHWFVDFSGLLYTSQILHADGSKKKEKKEGRDWHGMGRQ